MINVLFLCIGNSCRSQMAEGFARAYGSDVMRPFSAGLAPAPIVQPLTKQVMLEKNVNINGQFPKDITQIETQDFYMIVNITGQKLPIRACTELREWQVDDPIAQSEEIYRRVRDQLEDLVMQLILDLRRGQRRREVPQPVTKKMADAEAKVSRFGFGRTRAPRD